MARAPKSICEFVLEAPEFEETRSKLFFGRDNRGGNLLRYAIREVRYFYDFQGNSPKMFKKVLTTMMDFFMKAQRMKLDIVLKYV